MEIMILKVEECRTYAVFQSKDTINLTLPPVKYILNNYKPTIKEIEEWTLT